jgi:hypothetical protein
MLMVKSVGPSMSSLLIWGTTRSATGEDAVLDDPKASRSREYSEPAGDDGSTLGEVPRGGEDCILLESMFCRLLIDGKLMVLCWFDAMSRTDGDNFLSFSMALRVLLCVRVMCWGVLDISGSEKLGGVNAADDYAFAVA